MLSIFVMISISPQYTINFVNTYKILIVHAIHHKTRHPNAHGIRCCHSM